MMRGLPTLFLAGLLALIVPPLPAYATPGMPGDLPIPREYPENGGIDRADPDKPEDQLAGETAQADAEEAACQAGTATACTALGRAYHLGAGRPQNRPVAELLYRRACNADDGEGCHQLGRILHETRNYSVLQNAEGAQGPSDRQIAFQLFVRACRLGSIAGCDAEADGLNQGTSGEPDPQAAEALRRATCERGGRDACLTLAGLLTEHDRSLAEQDEGRALLDRQCRTGDVKACADAAYHWERLIAPDAKARMAEYQQLGCEAGDAWQCSHRAKTELARGQGATERATALVFFDRACSLLDYLCDKAAEIREEPGLTAACDNGDQSACITLGQRLSAFESPLKDDARALRLLGPACEAGASDVCLNAAELVREQSGLSGTPDPARLEAYLVAGCTAGSSNACETLADALAEGEDLPQDIQRASDLYVVQCEAGRDKACRYLEERWHGDPATPLVSANADFEPILTPEEEAEARRIASEEQQRQEAEQRARDCTTTTVVFEGTSYTDTICVSYAYMIGGFLLNPGQAPWQALLWRPETLLNRRRLKPADRVMCGGALIRDGWILTAGHCLNDPSFSGKLIKDTRHRVRLGLTNALEDDGVSYPIINTFRHPLYDPVVHVFDIGLVQFDPTRGTRGSQATTPARIRLDPQPLAQRKLEDIPRAFTYGWGLTSVGGRVSNALRGGRLKLRATAECTAITRLTDFRRDSVVCADNAGDAVGGQACSGDSGGPLITYSDADKRPTVIAVVSSGDKCGTNRNPSRYIRVAHPEVQKWLKEILPQPRPR